MLNPHIGPGLTFRQRNAAASGAASPRVVACERMRRHEQAERLARVGTFEIALAEGEPEQHHWSAGIHAILRRDRLKPPLSRQAYVLQYVHPDDQERVLAMSVQVMTDGLPVELDYRILRDDGGIAAVRERLALVATTATERLMFCDLQEVPNAEDSAGTPAGPSAGLQDGSRMQRGDPRNVQGLLATFDALRHREQERLAREMHDDFGQLLAAMKLDLCVLKKKLADAEPAAMEQVDSLQGLVDAMITSTRRIIAELPPKSIDELGLRAALDELIDAFRKRHSLRLAARLAPLPDRLDPGIELAAYRVLQEALNNVVRHSGATAAEVDVRASSTHLLLHVSDDGKGICPAELSKNGSFGLMWMRQRVKELGGTMEVHSGAGEGTAIAISIPLHPAPDAEPV